MKKPLIIAISTVAAAALVAIVLLLKNNSTSVAETNVSAAKADKNTSASSADQGGEVAAAADDESIADANLIRYLPDSLTLKSENQHPMLNAGASLKVVNRPLKNLRKLIESDEQGGYLNPIYSPDGLQIMLTRAGYQGIYLVSAKGGTPHKISDDNAFFAKWTADSLIEVRNNEGEVRLYDIDGTLLGISEYDPKKEVAYSDNDVVYLRGKDGSTPTALTDSNDRYIAPAAAPSGESVVYMGMYSGLYFADPKKGGEPVFLGAGGSNVEWNKKGDGFLFEDARDDGHAFVESDIYYYDIASGEKQNLTSEFDGVGLNPTIGPGGTVAFEVDGAIYNGVIP